MAVIVITGASAGVGRAAAREFAGRGDAVALIARGADGLEAAAKEADAAGARASLVLPLDVADAAALDDAARVVEAELGPIDGWVNNAMVSVFSSRIASSWRRSTRPGATRMLPREDSPNSPRPWLGGWAPWVRTWQRVMRGDAMASKTDTESGSITGTADKDYNIIWFTEASLKNALRLDTYIKDAERAGDDELAQFFRRAQDASRRGAEEGKRLLAARLSQASTPN
jgi:hypothetical protein